MSSFSSQLRSLPSPCSVGKPAVHVALPLLFADQAVEALHRRRCLHADKTGRRLVTRDLQEQLATGGGLELALLLNGNHERSRTADDAIGVIQIELGKIEEALRQLEHDRQAVDDDALGNK